MKSPLEDIQRTSWGRSASVPYRRPLNVRLGRPLDVVTGSHQDVRSEHPLDVRSGRSQDGQLRSLGDVLGRWRGTSSGRPGDQYLPARRFCKNIFIYCDIKIILISPILNLRSLSLISFTGANIYFWFYINRFHFNCAVIYIIIFINYII